MEGSAVGGRDGNERKGWREGGSVLRGLLPWELLVLALSDGKVGTTCRDIRMRGWDKKRHVCTNNGPFNLKKIMCVCIFFLNVILLELVIFLTIKK